MVDPGVVITQFTEGKISYGTAVSVLTKRLGTYAEAHVIVNTAWEDRVIRTGENTHEPKAPVKMGNGWARNWYVPMDAPIPITRSTDAGMMCNLCGSTMQKEADGRWWVCPRCTTTHDSERKRHEFSDI